MAQILCQSCGTQEDLAAAFIDQICPDCHRKSSGVELATKQRALLPPPQRLSEAAATALAQHVADKQRQSKTRRVIIAVAVGCVAISLLFVGFRYAQHFRAESNIALGDEALDRNDNDLAVSYFTQALRMEETNAVALLSRGFAHTQRHDFEKAAQDCSEAIRLAPAGAIGARAKSSRGYMHLIRGQGADYHNAVVDCTDAIQLDPKNLSAHFTRGKAYYFDHDYRPAITDFDKAEALKDARVFYFRGLCYLNLIPDTAKESRDARFVEQMKKVTADFRRAIELDETLKVDVDEHLRAYR